MNVASNSSLLPVYAETKVNVKDRSTENGPRSFLDCTKKRASNLKSVRDTFRG